MFSLPGPDLDAADRVVDKSYEFNDLGRDMTRSAYKVVWIATAPRTGSMWAYYVTRQILATGGRHVMLPPRELAEGQWPEYSLRVIADDQPGVIFCAKVHLRLALTIPAWRFVVTYRDVRDSTLSYMRFMRCNFEKALETTRLIMALTDHYFAAPDDVALKIRYDEVTQSPGRAALRIASFLDIEFSETQADALVNGVTRESVVRVVADYEQSVKSRLMAGSKEPFAYVKNSDGSIRLVEPTTLFQSGHITSARDGEWRDVLTREEQARLNELTIDWLRRHDFPID